MMRLTVLFRGAQRTKKLSRRTIASTMDVELPFAPMGVSQYQLLEEQVSLMKSKGIHNGSVKLDPEICGPFFVSPKHDGIRCVSYCFPPGKKSTAVKNLPAMFARPGRGAARSSSAITTTCFSRSGLPLSGLSWIEKELEGLRGACLDKQLCIDGELYVPLNRSPTTANLDISGKQAKKEMELVSPAPATPFARTFSIVRSLSDGRVFASEAAVAKFCAALPEYCIFDVISFSPCQLALSDIEKSPALRGVSQHTKNALKKAMGDVGVGHLEALAVVPDKTPFIARLRTLKFFTSLLHGLCPGSSDVSASSSSAVLKKQLREVHPQGGKSVRVIPYNIITDINAAKSVWLRRYLHEGYEGAVVRTAVNKYRLSNDAVTGKALKIFFESSDAEVRLGDVLKEVQDAATKKGIRSRSVAKLVPHFDQEYRIVKVVSGHDKSSPQLRTLEKLSCVTNDGRIFNVSVPFTVAERAALLSKMSLALGKHRMKEAPDSKSGGTVSAPGSFEDHDALGLFVTLQFPSLNPSGVPRFPRIKIIRGAKGAFI